MPQYTFDDDGNAIGVFLPIADWNRLKTKYNDLDLVDDVALPYWQTELIDKRLAAIEANPERLRPIEELYEEFDKD